MGRIRRRRRTSSGMKMVCIGEFLNVEKLWPALLCIRSERSIDECQLYLKPFFTSAAASALPIDCFERCFRYSCFYCPTTSATRTTVYYCCSTAF